MPSDDLMDWLGPAADELTAEQIERVRDEARRIAERYPDPDEQPERDAALSATVQYLLGETNAAAANNELLEARRRERAAYVSALQVAVMIVGDRQHAGQPPNKAGAARAVGIDRMRLLEALGERG
ncbi:hypothetical protein ABZS66_19300 [Dactylosporangium sp. NPDC005572]|uniref:hypothetical protein n=1 Tax=Dactylosporangium sp. NPDC005572 TaxID=3156889 RepID=UPI0033B73775